MLSIRSFARSAPRAVSRLTSSSVLRPVARPFALLQSTWKPSPLQYTAAFSTSNARREPAGKGDADLVAKLESEIAFETEMKEQDGTPASVTEYLSNGPFEITDTPGQEEVVLTRTFGDEQIRITFSIADLNSIDPENDYPDRALGDEEEGSEAEEKAESEESAEDAEGEEEGQSFPARLNIVVEKAGKGALSIESVAENGMIAIHNVYHYSDPALAHAKTAEKVHERQDLYVGPPFDNLDEDLQVLLERYLDERGIDTALAVFVPDYIEMKEQNEYLRWLSNVKSFVQ